MSILKDDVPVSNVGLGEEVQCLFSSRRMQLVVYARKTRLMSV